MTTADPVTGAVPIDGMDGRICGHGLGPWEPRNVIGAAVAVVCALAALVGLIFGAHGRAAHRGR